MSQRWSYFTVHLDTSDCPRDQNGKKLTEAGMVRWESGGDEHSETFESALHYLGELGWELVSTVEHGSGMFSKTIVFKKPS